MFKGVIVEQAFKNIPKKLANFAQSTVTVGRDLVDRFWNFKGEIDRRVANIRSKKEDTSTTKQTTTKSN
jgi:hypothetical protein